MARHIALDLNELDYLREQSKVNHLQQVHYMELVQSYETNNSKKDAQLALYARLESNWKTRYEALQAQKNPRYSFQDFLGDVGKFTAGAVLMAVLLLTR